MTAFDELERSGKQTALITMCVGGGQGIVHDHREAPTYMNNVIVLLHGSANGSYSWRRVQRTLTSLGLKVFAVVDAVQREVTG